MTSMDSEDPTGTDDAAATRRAALRELKTRATDKAAKTRSDLEARRATSRTIETIFSTFEGDVTAGGGVLAGAVAFRIFLFQIPYTFFLVTLLGAFESFSLKAITEDQGSVGIAGLTARAISTASDLSTWGRIGALIAGAFATYLGARSAVKVLWVVHTLLWRLPPSKPRTNAATLGFIGLVTVSLALTGLVGRVQADTAIGGFLLLILADAIYGIAWLFVSLRLPHEPDATWSDMLPGAALFAFGTLLLHLVTVYWISYQLESKSETYGAIGASLALLLWAYLMGRVITASAVLNHARWHQTHPREVQ
jgi:uncharacterized BrkB/YihY/UPF0761 family membrane protein